ncbi:hypothetical protein D3C85_1911570 [compost metagenome]
MIGTLIGCQNIVAYRHATGVGVLDDNAGRFGELFHALQCRIGIGDVVVRQRFAL